MKKQALLFTSLAIFCSVGNAESQAIYSNTKLHIPHLSYNGLMYDVIMTYKPTSELIVDSAKVLQKKPSAPVVKVSSKLVFTLTDIDVSGENYRVDVGFVKGKFTSKEVGVMTYRDLICRKIKK